MAFIQTRRCDDYLVVTILHYGIDATNYNDLKSIISNDINAGQKKIIMNLANVIFMDSLGIGSLINIKNKLGPEGTLYIMGLTPEVAKVFGLARLQRYFKILDLNNYPMKCPFCAPNSPRECNHPQILFKIQEELYIPPPDGTQPSFMSKLDMTVKAITGQLNPDSLMNQMGDNPDYYNQQYPPQYQDNMNGQPPYPQPNRQSPMNSIMAAAKSITKRLTGRLPGNQGAAPSPMGGNPMPPPNFKFEQSMLREPAGRSTVKGRGRHFNKILIYGAVLLFTGVIIVNLKWIPNTVLSNLALQAEEQITALIIVIQDTIFPPAQSKKKKKITKDELNQIYDKNADGEFTNTDWKLLDAKTRLELINRGYKPKR